jgi:hypothetical protein
MAHVVVWAWTEKLASTATCFTASSSPQTETPYAHFHAANRNVRIQSAGEFAASQQLSGYVEQKIFRLTICLALREKEHSNSASMPCDDRDIGYRKGRQVYMCSSTAKEVRISLSGKDCMKRDNQFTARLHKPVSAGHVSLPTFSTM